MLSKILNYFHTSENVTKSRNFDYYLDHLVLDNKNTQSYKNNVVVHRCVDLISQSAAHVHLLAYVQDKKSEKLSRILHKPNHLNSGSVFFEKVIAHKLLFGNSYIMMTKASEMFVLHPNSVDISVEQSRITGYKYTANDKTYFYSLDHMSGKSQVLHIKNYNPYSEIYGISNLDAAQSAIELHNQAMQWNNALLQNGARPSGALVMKGDNAYLSDEQFSRLKAQLSEKYSGAANSGKPILLEGGLDWKEMSISPKDMDFIESKSSAAREIALAFGVPPQLLGIAGDNTYSNMQEARLALWEETIIPLLDNLTDSLSTWLSSLMNNEVRIEFDKESISALAERRENIWAKISAANFMTINEKRAIIGLPPILNGDHIA